MGVEWDIGCQVCKKFIWMGSMKPFKWHGFQVSDATIRRFFSLHAIAQKKGCHLYLMTDSGGDTPWSNDVDAWQEDIVSRSFWDSIATNDHGSSCAYCGKALKEKPLSYHYLQRNQCLWLCNQDCVEAYVARTTQERNHWGEGCIYDSTLDTVWFDPNAALEIGCTECHSYVVIDGKSVDAHHQVYDFEYLALFLGKHIGHCHLLVHFEGAGQPITVPWHNETTASQWTVYTRYL
ncbi:hypothetical protein [Microscilla marina]|nr:hypothetical protein [Microscilla marina]